MCAGGGEPVCELLWCAHNSLSVCIVVLVFIIPEPLDALARITAAKAVVDVPHGHAEWRYSPPLPPFAHPLVPFLRPLVPLFVTCCPPGQRRLGVEWEGEYF